MLPVSVFVYGTLKSGYGNNRILQRSSRFLCDAITVDSFLLTDIGFPYLVPEHVLEAPRQGLQRQVYGEVWEVMDESTMASLDSLESVGWHYDRTTISVQLMHGEVTTVYTYVPCDPRTQDYRICPTQMINDKEVYIWHR